jgi:hypothetical protein
MVKHDSDYQVMIQPDQYFQPYEKRKTVGIYDSRGKLLQIFVRNISEHEAVIVQNATIAAFKHGLVEARRIAGRVHDGITINRIDLNG